MKKNFFLCTFMLLLTSLTVEASVWIDGLCYTLSGNEAKITRDYTAEKYSGDIVIPSTIEYYGTTFSVTSIGASAFFDCQNLSSVTIPNSVTSIESEAFAGCKNLSSIVIPNSVVSISDYAFDGCTSFPMIDHVRYADTYLIGPDNKTLTTYKIKDGTRFIKSEAFANCKNLSKITIPSSVIYIGERAFQNCNSLPEIDNMLYADTYLVKYTPYKSSGKIKAGTRFIGSSAFCGTSLETIEIPNTVIDVGAYAFAYCEQLSSIRIPNSVVNIGRSAFEGCVSLKTIEIQNPTANIDKHAFDGCTSLPVTDNIRYADTYLLGPVDKTLTTCNIKNGTKCILEEAFSYCENLTSITIPTSVTNIGSRAFSGCAITSIEIPSSVKTIGRGIFESCKNLTSISIPRSLTSIPEYTFCGCEKLSAISIPNSVTSIEYAAFFGCDSLTSIVIPNSVIVLGDNLFGEAVTDVVIGNSVRDLGNKTFGACNALNSITVVDGNPVFDSRDGCNAIIVTATNTLIKGFKISFIPSTITAIGAGAFESVKGISSIDIPNSVVSIGDNAFEYTRLTSVLIPNSVKEIGREAFRECVYLNTISIGKSVSSIGESAFAKCGSLKDVYCFAETLPSCDSNEFERSNISSVTLHVPASSISLYQSTAPWSNFGSIVPLTEEETGIDNICEYLPLDVNRKFMKNGKVIVLRNGLGYHLNGIRSK